MAWSSESQLQDEHPRKNGEKHGQRQDQEDERRQHRVYILHMTTACYARISLDRTGEGLGVERQVAECRELASRLGITVDEVFIDNDVSATSGVQRPEFDRMLASEPTAILAWHQDRLLRLTRDLERVIDLGVPVYTVTAGTLDLATPSGRAVARTVATWSQYEGEQKAARQRSANDQRAAKGLPTARHGYGYDRANGRDVIVEAEAAVIREAAERVLGGESLRSISADLNRRGLPSPRASERIRMAARAGTIDEGTAIPWSTATLRQMLRRPSLAGLRTHRGKVAGGFDPSVHPAILDRDTHDRLVALFSDPARRTGSGGGQPPKHLLSGIAWCGRCADTLGGRVIRLPAWTPKPGQTSRATKAAYACNTCHKVRRLQEPVEELVTEYVLQRLEREDAAELFATGDPAVVKDARAAIAAATARLASAADMFASGTIDADQLARITSAGRAERDRFEAQLAKALPSALPRDAIGAKAREVWGGYDIERRRLIIRTLCRVTIMPAGPGGKFDPDLVRVEWLSDAS